MKRLRLGICCRVWLVLLHPLLVAWLGAGACFAGDVAIDEILLQMSEEGSKFNSETLQKEGLGGLSRLLDKLFPQTAKQPDTSLSEDEVTRLIRQLGAEGFGDREYATRRIGDEAEVFRGLVEQASQDPDPEIRARVWSILGGWDARAESFLRGDVGKYADALSVYLDGITDEAMLSHLSRRARQALEAKPVPEGQLRLLTHCVSTIAKSGDDRFTDHLTPLLGHKDVEIAIWVTRTVGSHSGNRYLPGLLLEALKSDREGVVGAALSWTPNCWDRDKSGDVKRLVTAVFEGDNEALKFHACFTMMHDYGDKRAIGYLLNQANSPDKARAARAISWIGDSCNGGRKASPQLLASLVPLLKSEDKEVRRRAADAIGTYQGAQVVDVLIQLLGDQEEIIRREVCSNLLGQRDKGMLRDRLADAVENAQSETVQARLEELLGKLAEGR